MAPNFSPKTVQNNPKTLRKRSESDPKCSGNNPKRFENNAKRSNRASQDDAGHSAGRPAERVPRSLGFFREFRYGCSIVRAYETLRTLECSKVRNVRTFEDLNVQTFERLIIRMFEPTKAHI